MQTTRQNPACAATHADTHHASPAACADLLQVAISKFTQVGGLQAVEERSIAVQDFEAKLEELDRLAETYRVGATGPGNCTGAASMYRQASLLQF